MATAFDEVGRIPNGWFSAIIVGVLLSAYITEEINIAFIFGGFVMGMIMPRHARLTEEFTRRIEDFVVTLLLPVFFVYTGLRTNIGLLNRPELWLITLALIAIAILGKLAGAAIAARTSGMSWRESAVVGTLMNTRGLTELIVLNLALSVGAISNVLFAALVIMAIVTTLMAGPLLKLLDPKNEYGSKVEDEFDEAAMPPSISCSCWPSRWRARRPRTSSSSPDRCGPPAPWAPACAAVSRPRAWRWSAHHASSMTCGHDWPTSRRRRGVSPSRPRISAAICSTSSTTKPSISCSSRAAGD
jgi:hypothetical protein